MAQIFQMRVRMKNLMGVMEGGSIPALSELEDAMKAEQKVSFFLFTFHIVNRESNGLLLMNLIQAPPGTARRKKRKADSRKKFVESASSNPGPRGFGN